MTFDVFRDFETKGYLRNFAGEKDLNIVKRLEHVAFRANVGDALDTLAQTKTLDDAAVLDTHRRLFGSVYPWAGQANPIPVKWAMARMGLCGGTLRLPMTPLESSNEAAVESALRACSLI